jgi:hypothetical protein
VFFGGSLPPLNIFKEAVSKAEVLEQPQILSGGFYEKGFGSSISTVSSLLGPGFCQRQRGHVGNPEDRNDAEIQG